MREVVLSALAGFLTSCAGGFMLHRSIWKNAHAHAEAVEALSPTHRKQVAPSVAKNPDSFEAQIGRRAANWWNNGVDNVHGRLLRLPGTMKTIVEDAKGAGEGSEK